MWGSPHGFGFEKQLAAAGLQGLVGLLVAGDADGGAVDCGPQGGERRVLSSFLLPLQVAK